MVYYIMYMLVIANASPNTVQTMLDQIQLTSCRLRGSGFL